MLICNCQRRGCIVKMHNAALYFLILWVWEGYRFFFKCWYSLPRWPKLFHKIIFIFICANTNIYDVLLFKTNQQSLISCFEESSNNHTLFFFKFWLQNCTTVCFLFPYIKNKLPFHVNSWRQISSYVTD